MNQPLMSTRDAAAYLNERGIPYAPATLEKLRCVGGGPRFRKYGPRVRYDRADLDAWADSKISDPVSSTSELARAS